MPRDLIGQRGQIIHSVSDRHILVEVEMLSQFLEAAMQIADVRDGLQDLLAVQCQHQPESCVGGRVLRAEIQCPDVFTFFGF